MCVLGREPRRPFKVSKGGARLFPSDVGLELHKFSSKLPLHNSANQTYLTLVREDAYATLWLHTHNKGLASFLKHK